LYLLELIKYIVIKKIYWHRIYEEVHKKKKNVSPADLKQDAEFLEGEFYFFFSHFRRFIFNLWIGRADQRLSASKRDRHPKPFVPLKCIWRKFRESKIETCRTDILSTSDVTVKHFHHEKTWQHFVEIYKSDETS